MKKTGWNLVCCAALIGTAFTLTAADFNTGVTLSKNDAEAKKTDSRRTPDVIYVPTPQEAVDQMLEMADVKKTDVVYDLGCGDGRIVVTAAKKYGVKAYGFDIDPERIAESKENVRKNKVEHLVTIEEKDIFTLDLSKADVVTLYLLPSLNVKLIPQLEKLKPGSRIVSHSFDMEGIKPDRVVRDGSTILYKWTTPLKREKNGETAEAK
jgi:tRNA G37 N-methylase Trm5